MASAEDYANWIVKNADKKGTPEFETVAKAYQLARSQGGADAPTPTREQESQAELARLNKMVAEKGAPTEGMPSPRAPSAFEQSEFYQRTKNAPEILMDVIRPGDIGANIASVAQQSWETGRRGLNDFTSNIVSGRPASAVLGLGQNILGTAGVVASPITGTTKTFVADPLARTFGPEVGERAQVVADFAAGPKMVTAAARPIVWATNKGLEGVNAAQNILQPKYNWLGEAVGQQGPDIVNALRANVSGVEGAGQAAAPVRNVAFSQFTKALEKYAPQVADDTAATQDALLTARKNIAEGEITAAEQKLANVVAEPNQQKIGEKLEKIADQEIKTSRKTVTGPAYDAVEVSARDATGKDLATDVTNVYNKTQELIDTVHQDAAKNLSNKIKKYAPTTTTVERIGPGGASRKETIVSPPMATIADLNDIRTAVNDEIAAAKARAGSASDLRRLRQLHKEIDNAINNSTTFSDETKALYNKANELYATEHTPRFNTGLQQNVYRDRANESAIKPEDFVPKFMAGPSEADNFVALFGKNSEAMNYARQGVEGMFRDAAIVDGKINTTKAKDFLQRYRAQIDTLDANGLNLRGKFDALIKEADRVSAPKGRVVEVEKAIKGGALPEGVSEAQIAQRVDELVKTTSAEDLASLRDALQVARRRGEFKRQAERPIAKEFNLPSPAPQGSDWLNIPLRLATAVYRGVTGKLTSNAAKALGELLSDPKRLNEAADLIEKAIAMKARQTNRKFGPVTAPPYAGVPSAAINALAPPNQNSLAGQ